MILKIKMRIGLCIPCAYKDLNYLQDCIDTVNIQTVRPDLISISVSGVPKNQAVSIKTDIPFKISVSDFCKGPSENRNIAAEKIKNEVDILTFIDADDFLCSRYIEYIGYYFDKYPIDMFLHNFYKTDREYYFSDLKYVPNSFSEQMIFEFKMYRERLSGRVIPEGQGEFHNAHTSCKTHVWENVKFPENMFIGEDSEFTYKCAHLYKLGYCPDKLTYYIKPDFIIHRS